MSGIHAARVAVSCRILRSAAAVLMAMAAVACGGAGSSAPAPAAAASTGGWQAEDEQYRRDLETKLTSDTGWLTIAGLAFLTKADTTVGSDRANDVVLPGAPPPHLGTFVLAANGHVSVRLEPNLQVKLLDG